jgi:hypothetical protein
MERPIGWHVQLTGHKILEKFRWGILLKNDLFEDVKNIGEQSYDDIRRMWAAEVLLLRNWLNITYWWTLISVGSLAGDKVTFTAISISHVYHTTRGGSVWVFLSNTRILYVSAPEKRNLVLKAGAVAQLSRRSRMLGTVGMKFNGITNLIYRF